jgi:UDP-2,3-diacylglucosamine hydrolase
LDANVNSLGLIAGNGIFPLEVAGAARKRGIKLIALAHQGETQPELASAVDQLTWIKVGELQKIIDVLKEAGVEQAAMAGGISRARLGTSFAPDQRAMTMLASITRWSDDAVLRAIAREIESEGIPVIDPVPLMDDAVAKPGAMVGPAPDEKKLHDLALAFNVARSLGAFDIGQSVAVRGGVVYSVEAVEGTDAALRRAAQVAGKGLVIAKVAKPGQDLRFDRPAIGPATIELMMEIGAAIIGVEAGKCLLLERERTLAMAQSAGLTVFGHE